MEPLRTRFARLNTQELERFAAMIKAGENPVSCDACIFSNCNGCQYPKKRIKDIVIESYIPLVMDIAMRLCVDKYQEAVGVGLLALTEAVDRANRETECLTAYVGASVTKAIKNFIMKDTLIKVPYYGQENHSHLKHVFRIDGNIPTEGEQGVIELRELLARIPKTRNEEVVMRCIAEGGYSLREMAEMCRVDRTRISQIKQSLLGRVAKVLY